MTEAAYTLAHDLTEAIRAFDGYPSEFADYVKATLGRFATPGVVHNAVAASVAAWHTEGQVDRLETMLVDVGADEDDLEALLDDLFSADLRPGISLADRLEIITGLSKKHAGILQNANLVLHFERICEQITDQERAEAHLFAFILEEVTRRASPSHFAVPTVH